MRDRRTGEPTGVLKDQAMDPAFAAMPERSAEEDDRALDRAMAFLASKGVTAVASVSAGWDQVAAVERAKQNGSLTLRLALFPALADWHRVADSRRGARAGRRLGPFGRRQGIHGRLARVHHRVLLRTLQR